MKASMTIAIFHLASRRKLVKHSHLGRVSGSVAIKRERRDLKQLFLEIGPTNFQRMYRMHEVSFYQLFELLQQNFKSSQETRRRGATVNGPITKKTRLAMALRWCAGVTGSKCDIATTHGVHVDEVYTRLWQVGDAIHPCEALDIKFPTKHEDQQRFANEFKARSFCGFGNCVVALDGMPVWINRPKEDKDDLGVGAGKFFNGRKKKFGLQLQGTCGPNSKFLGVTCDHPGSTSDFTIWLDCSLRRLIETPGFLKFDLQIY